MSGEPRIFELTEFAAKEYCKSEGLSLPKCFQTGGDLNAYWGFVAGEKVLGIMYGHKEELKILLLGFLSNNPKKTFSDIVTKKIYAWKQMGIVVESRIEEWALGRNDMLLPCSVDKILKAMGKTNIQK